MSLEIHTPELERRVREGIESGRFHDVDEFLSKALDAWLSLRLPVPVLSPGPNAPPWKVCPEHGMANGSFAMLGCRSRLCSKTSKTAPQSTNHGMVPHLERASEDFPARVHPWPFHSHPNKG
jgi:hypothetical protein